jgi:hypothetical protein
MVKLKMDAGKKATKAAYDAARHDKAVTDILKYYSVPCLSSYTTTHDGHTEGEKNVRERIQQYFNLQHPQHDGPPTPY